MSGFSMQTLVALSYFAAATLFLLGLQRMASPKTARSGIQWAGVGMVLATIATFALPNLHNIGLILVAVVVGVVPTWLWGKKVAVPPRRSARLNCGKPHRAANILPNSPWRWLASVR